MSYRVGFISGKQERFHIQKSINIIYHINKLKVKNHLIFLLGIEKAFDNILTKIQHLFVIKKNLLSNEFTELCPMCSKILTSPAGHVRTAEVGGCLQRAP